MKNSYFAKTLSIGFFLIIFLSGGKILAQNNSFLYFDGSNDYVKYFDDSYLDRMNGASNYIIEAWVYVSSSCPSGAQILHRTNQFYLYYYSSASYPDALDFRVWDGSAYQLYYSNKNTLTTDTWHHIAVIRNTSLTNYLHFYIDGVDQTSASKNGYQLYSSSKNLYIGNDGNGGNYFKGYIDEVRLKNIAVSSSNLNSNITDNQYSSDANTAVLFHFNEGTGQSTANEASGVGARLGSTTGSDNEDPTWTDWDAIGSSDHLPLAYEWTGSTDTDWGTSGNWEGGVPTSANDVLIPTGLTNYPTISNTTNGECNNLLIDSKSADNTGSLIVKGTLTNNGTISIERYMTSYSSSSNGWHFLSSPVSNFTIAGSDFEPTAGDDDLFEYDESATDNNWLNYTGGTFGDTEFQVGKGYLTAYKNTNTKTFTGNITTGTKTFNLSYTSSSTYPGWNLMGNPYTSAVDWDLISKSADVDGAVYVIKADDGSYISWNGTTGDLTDGIIPAMQGFFVKASSTGQSITMETDDQVHATGNYYKSSALAENTLKINIKGASGESNEYIQFRDDATVHFDGAFDAYKLYGFSKAPQLYTYDGETQYSINCLPTTIQNYSLIMGAVIYSEGDYTLTFEENNELSEQIDLTLEDLKTGQVFDVFPQFTYTFHYSNGDEPDRFKLHIRNITGVNNSMKNDNIIIFSADDQIIIKSENIDLSGLVKVYNLTGQLVSQEQLFGQRIATLNKTLKKGFYIVSFKDEKGNVYNQKVVLR